MIELAESINTFGIQPEANFVPNSDQLITLTYGQLEDLVTRTVQDATKSFLTRLDALEDKIDLAYGNLALEIARDRQRLTTLEQAEPQPLQRDRGEILRALLVANGGKMLATDARKKMHLSRQTFSELLSILKDEIEAKPYHLNKSWKVLMLR